MADLRAANSLEVKAAAALAPIRRVSSRVLSRSGEEVPCTAAATRNVGAAFVAPMTSSRQGGILLAREPSRPGGFYHSEPVDSGSDFGAWCQQPPQFRRRGGASGIGPIRHVPKAPQRRNPALARSASNAGGCSTRREQPANRVRREIMDVRHVRHADRRGTLPRRHD